MEISYNFDVKCGNLLDENADFLLNPSNTKMLLGSGVSRAFYIHCGGYKLEKLMQECLPVRQGDVVKTISNAPNFSYALHAVVIDYSSKKNKFPTLQTLQTILLNLQTHLLESDKNDLKIALPLIGCGIGGLDKKEVLQVYKDFFLQNDDASKSCKVVVYGYTQDDFDLIKEILWQ